MLLQATTTTAHSIGGPSTANLPVMVFFVFATVFPVLPLLLGRFLRPLKYQQDKMRPYERGIDPESGAHDRITVSYYIVARLFRIVYAVSIFLLRWATI